MDRMNSAFRSVQRALLTNPFLQRARSEIEEDSSSDDDDDRFVTRGSSPTERTPLASSSRRSPRMHPRQSSGLNAPDALSSDKQAFLTLVKSFVATGVLFLPIGFQRAGLVAAMFTLLVCAAASYYAILLILDAADLVDKRHPSYADVGFAAFGKHGANAVSASIVLSQLGFCCVYVGFVGSVARNVLLDATRMPETNQQQTDLDEFLTQTSDTTMWLTLIVLVPLSLIRTLKRFSFFIFVANVSIVCSLVYISIMAAKALDVEDWNCDFVETTLIDFHRRHDIVEKTLSPTMPIATLAPTPHHPPPGVASNATGLLRKRACFWVNKQTVLSFVGTAVYAFEGVSLVLPIRKTMENPRHFKSILWRAMLLVTFVFAFFGSINFYAFKGYTQDTAINNLPSPSFGKYVVSLLYVIVAIVSFPLMLFPATTAVEAAVLNIPDRNSGRKHLKNANRVFFTLLCVVVAVYGAGELPSFVSFVGAALCVPLALVFPPAFYLKLAPPERFSYPALLLLVCGVAAWIVSTIVAISSWGE